MKLTFLGANHEVTGSCTLLETGGLHILIDCGMEQGKDVYENQPLPIPVEQIDGVLLTHAHIDHSGLTLCKYQAFPRRTPADGSRPRFGAGENKRPAQNLRGAPRSKYYSSSNLPV